MAAIVALVRRRDFGTDISVLSLLGYENGFQLPRGGWIQAVAGDDAEVAEAMTLYVQASSPDDLAAKLQLLDDKIREVGWYADDAERYGVWLRAQMADETQARQALVTGMRCEPAVSFYGSPVAPGNFVRGYNLALERMPWWEATSSELFGAFSSSCLGGSYNYGNITGNLPARIFQTVLQSSVLGEVWLGFRTEARYGSCDFVSTWECELGTLINSTSPVSDTTTASNGSKAQCTFADASILPRVTIKISDITTIYARQRGTFDVLLRAKVSSGTCRVRLATGYASAVNWKSYPRQKIESTSWYLYPLGQVTIPPTREPTVVWLRQFALQLQAERVSVSGNLDMDCLILIPVTEGALHVSGIVGSESQIRTPPESEAHSGISFDGGEPAASLTINAQNYSLPVGKGKWYTAGQRTNESILADNVYVTLYYLRRWRTLRGAE